MPNKIIIMKQCLVLLIAVLFLGINIPVLGQSNALKTANELFNRYEYSKAIGFYEQVLRKEKNNAEALEKLAECYRLTSNTRKAESAYKKAIKFNPENHLLVFRLGQALMSNQKYKEALDVFINYTELAPYDNRGWVFAKDCKYFDRLQLDSAQYNISKPSFNSKASDYAPAFFKEGLVFTSNRTLTSFDIKDGWTGESFQDLFYVAELKDGWDTPVVLEGKTNIPAHEGPAVFNVHNTIMYFNRSELKSELKKTGTSFLKLYQAKWANGRWQDVEALPFNKEGYSIGHPALSPNGKTLYFTADFPGGFGGKDLYMSQYTQGKWSEPENLGPEINTRGDEMFPTIQDDGSLFFSSDGWGGLGGTDIYMANKENNAWVIKNLGFPLNSSKDDFGLILTKDKRTGYFASNREGSLSDDIYKVEIKPKKAEQLIEKPPVIYIEDEGTPQTPIKQVSNSGSEINPEDVILVSDTAAFVEQANNTIILNGFLFSKIYNEPMNGKTIVLTDKLPLPNKQKVIRTNTSENGSFHFLLKRDKLYQIDVLNSDNQVNNSLDITTVHLDKDSIYMNVIVWSDEIVPVPVNNVVESNPDTLLYNPQPIEDQVSDIPEPETDKEILTFKIQIGAFKKPLLKTNSFLTKLPHPSQTEFSPNGLTRYVSGNFDNPVDAFTYYNQLIKMKYLDSFIVVYVNNVRSTKTYEEALQKLLTK